MKKKNNTLLANIIQALEDKKALEIVTLDVGQIVSYTDYLVLCSGTSSTHVSSIVASLRDGFPKGEGPIYTNGSKDDSWWILDFVDVVVHVFKEDARRFYNLENLLGDSIRVEV